MVRMPKRANRNRNSKPQAERFVADDGTSRVACEVTWTGGELALPQGNGDVRAYVCNAIADGRQIVGAALVFGGVAAADRDAVLQQFGVIVERE